jgi:tetratricopeptide (TPR) repeat protein
VRLIENKQQSQPECIFEKCQYAYSDARDSIAALHYLAIIYDLQGKFDQAEQVYHYTFPYLYQRFRETPSAWAEPYERREIINIRERCKEAIQAAKGNESPYLATRIEQIAISNYNNGAPTFTYGKIQEREQNYAMSEALFRQALAIRQIANDAADLEILHFDLEYLRQSLEKQMKLKDACNLDDLWLTAVEKAHGPNSTTLAQVLIRVGGDESRAKDCKTAIMHLQRAVQIYGVDQNREIKSHPFDQRFRNILLGAFSYLADCYKCQGMIAEANECIRRRAECVE